MLLHTGDSFEWDASAQWRLLRWYAPLLRETLSSKVLQLSEDFETFNPPVPKQKVRTSPDGAVVTRLNSCPLRVKTTGCQKGFVVRLPIESLRLPVLARTLCFSSVKTFLGLLIYTWDFDTNFHLVHQIEDFLEKMFSPFPQKVGPIIPQLMPVNGFENGFWAGKNAHSRRSGFYF